MNETGSYAPDNFFAGSYPVLTDSGTIATDAKIEKHAPLVMGDSGITAAAADALDGLIGIAADVPSGDKVVYYMTGEYFAESLVLPEGVTAADLKAPFRKLGIFLR